MSLKLYCLDCEMSVCSTCLVKKHKLHSFSGVDQVAERQNDRLGAVAKKATKLINEVQMREEQLKAETEDVEEQFKSAEALIVGHEKAWKSLLENHMAFLRQQLASLKTTRLNEIQVARKDVVTGLVRLATIKGFCDELVEKGSVSEMALVDDGLQRKV